MDQRAASISSSVGLGIILISQFIGLAALFSSALTTNENKHIIQRANNIIIFFIRLPPTLNIQITHNSQNMLLR